MKLSWCPIIALLKTVTPLEAFTVTPSPASTSRPVRHEQAAFSQLLASSSSEDDDEAERMEKVRRLQKTFYASTSSDGDEPSSSSSSSGGRTEFEESTGRMLNLPLWRVGWVEVPGRSNCLNVHEGHYTNMFEKILRSGDGKCDGWYFGHLYLPGGTESARSGEKRFQLKDWKQEIGDENRFDEKERSSVIGCLMRITDYRRLKDGRLILLVQALDRFLVDTVVESFPHGVAHVQLLPDIEDTIRCLPREGASAAAKPDENFGRIARAKAIRRSFDYYDYECNPTPLPLPKDTEYMSPQDVFGPDIAKCLPFCFYSKDDSLLDKIHDEQSVDDDTSAPQDDNGEGASDSSFVGGRPLLEDQLRAELVLRDPAPVPGVARRQTDDIDALEKLLWLALEDCCRNYKFTLPEEVSCLMPVDMMDYLDIPPPKHPVSEKYSARKRQKRLSYAVPALIENTNIGSAIPTRQILLNSPGTRSRLVAILERLELLNNAVLGQFE